MMKKPIALVSAMLLTTAITAGCSNAADTVDKAKDTANEKVQEAGEKATDAAKNEASKAAAEATDAAKTKAAEATDAAKTKAAEATDAAKTKAAAAGKFNPNKMTVAEITSALNMGGVPDAEKVAKSIKAAGPFTTENLRPKLEKVAAEHKIEKAQIDRIIAYIDVK